MKKKEFKELKGKEVKELLKAVNEKKLALAKFLTGKSGEKNTKKGANLKREIARILTLITEKGIIGDEAKENK